MADRMVSLKKFVANLAIGSEILITGASGLIGRNLLLRLSDELVQSGRLDIRINAHIRRPESKDPFWPETINLIVSDDLELPIDSKFDVIFHFATYGQPGKFTRDPLDTMRLNSQALFHLEMRLKPNGIFYFASSSELYSGNTNYPHKESEAGFTNTIHPRSMYIESKRFGEAFCFWQSQAGRNFFSGRIALSYGPGAKVEDERVLNELVVRGLRDKRIVLRDDGSAIRQYCFVDDTIDSIFVQINSKHYSPLNICGNSFVSIRELAEEIGKQLNVKVFTGTVDLSNTSGAPQVVSSSLTNLNKLGKTNFVDLSSGIKEVISWYKGILEL